MAREAIEAIFTAEKNASALVDQAKAEARQSSRQLEAAARKLSEEMWDTASREISATLDKAKEKAEAKAQPILDKAERQTRAYRDIEAAAIDKAADLVIEQVTKYGNR
ncbi:MAG: hypothetical protein Q4E09_03925 [Eubacteriales bacterium]|nr:hypothetical protein [Eubacteriales bacterium]